MRDTAFKLFRGTIDFVKGSAGSVGNEKEEVLLIDENVSTRLFLLFYVQKKMLSVITVQL